MVTIWCLFSIDMNYDQPDNNLVVWWKEKPTLEVLFKALKITLDGKTPDKDIVSGTAIWTGKRMDIREVSYRLEQVPEGKSL